MKCRRMGLQGRKTGKQRTKEGGKGKEEMDKKGEVRVKLLGFPRQEMNLFHHVSGSTTGSSSYIKDEILQRVKYSVFVHPLL